MNMVRKIALLIALALFFALPAQAKPGVVEFLDPNCTPTPEPGVQIPTATISPEAAALPWNLTLVNRTNPVPPDWTVELKELSNGQKVDARIYADLQAMFDACRADGLKPMVMTSYRTYEDQQDMVVLKYRRYKNGGLSHVESHK